MAKHRGTPEPVRDDTTHGTGASNITGPLTEGQRFDAIHASQPAKDVSAYPTGLRDAHYVERVNTDPDN